MSSDFKLEIGGEEPLVSTRNGNVEQNERAGTVHKILSGIRHQGSKSISNFLTNAQRRTLGDRYSWIVCPINYLSCSNNSILFMK